MSIQSRFLSFHRGNPEVFEELKRLALQARRKGRERIGIRMLWEVMRWNLTIEGDSEYKLNDHFHSRYARLLNKIPELKGMFELRRLRS